MATATLSRGQQKREEIVKFIRAYWRKHHMAPSIQEVAEGVDLASHSTVRDHLLQLRVAKRVTWVEGKNRSLRLVETKKR